MQHILSQLEATQKQITGLLISVVDDQDWKPDPDQWSFRYIAAHLATVEEECFLDRIIRIASGENPQFNSYFNTGRNFDSYQLSDSLEQWTNTRKKIFKTVRNLPDKKLRFTGTHDTFGRITIPDVLQTMLDHDKGHLKTLQQMVVQYRESNVP